MKKGSLILVFSVLVFNLSSQIFPTNGELTSRFNSRVKLLDEFIKRFNHIESNKELSISQDAYHSVYLFNLENKSLTSKQESIDFVKMIANDSFTQNLSFFSDGMYAILNSNYIINGKSEKIRFILKIRVSDKGYAWVISKIDPVKIDSSLVTNHSTSIQKYQSINPVDNEVNFIQFSEILKQNKISKRNFAADIDSNLVSNYIQFLNSDKNKFQDFLNVQYHFLQIDNYHFTLDFFLRPTNNSGWLISSLSKITPDQKEQLINTIYK